MDFLRVFLFLGLVLHKLLWQVLKSKDRNAVIRQWSATPSSKWPIKIVKAAVLVFIAVQTLFLDLLPISDEPSTLRVIGTVVYTFGLATAVIGRVHLGKNWVDLEDYQILPQQSVATDGIYRYIRHPIYTGDLLLLIGLELALNSWLILPIAILLPVIIVRQALIEESLLLQAFPAYNAYCRRTKRFIPFLL